MIDPKDLLARKAIHVDEESFRHVEEVMRLVTNLPDRTMEREAARVLLASLPTAKYRRVSSGKQLDGYGQAAQDVEIMGRVAAFNWKKPERCYEDHVTASGRLLRSDFVRMLADARNGKFKVLLVGRADRFARNVGQGWLYLYELIAAGVYVYFCRENVCANLDKRWHETITDRLKASEDFIHNLRENMNISVQLRRGRREWLGHAPFGWRRSEDKEARRTS